MNMHSTRGRKPHLAGLLLATLLVWPLGVVAAQGAPAPTDAKEAVARLAGLMAKSDPEAIWDSVMELRGYGKAAIEPIEAIYPSQEPVARLGLAATLAELDEFEGSIDRALGLVTDKSLDTSVRLVAAQLVTRYGRQIDDRDFAKTLEARLEDFLDDPINSLPVKVAVSQTLYDIFGVTRGRNDLRDYLKSQDITVRNLAALSLAEIGEFTDPDVNDVLNKIKDEPGARGELARSYISLDYYQRKLEKAQGGKWALLTEIEQKIKEFHIYGDTDLAYHDRLLAQAAKGMLAAMDRHSTWYTAKEYKDFEEDLNRDYGGIGAYVGFRGEPPAFTILRPIYSGPADRKSTRLNSSHRL